MDKKSKILIVFFLTLLVGITILCYYKYIQKSDFTVYTEEESIPSINDMLKF